MNSFTRMRAFKKDGRLAVVLKITLPMLKEDGEFAEFFNSFYTSIADSYMKAVERDSSEVTLDKTVKVLVEWGEVPKEMIKLKRREKKYPGTFICISRTLRVFGEIKSTETDLFYKHEDLGVILR